MSKKFARNLTLAITLATLSGSAAHADPGSTPTPASTSSVTGGDPVPTNPNQWPTVISIILSAMSSVL
jgi:hypothetical protein